MRLPLSDDFLMNGRSPSNLPMFLATKLLSRSFVASSDHPWHDMHHNASIVSNVKLLSSANDLMEKDSAPPLFEAAAPHY
jgi:hypothetical protein